MKKEIAALLAAGMLLAVTSCDKAPEESQTETQTETTATSTTQSEETTTESETQKQYSSDVDSQDVEYVIKDS